MKWTEVTIITTPEAVEAISGILHETGVGGISVEDPTLLLETNRTTKNWDVLDKDVQNRYSIDKAVIKAYYPPDSNMQEILRLIREGMSMASEYINVQNTQILSAIVNEQDWENNWKQFYKPIHVGNHIIIKPLWEDIETTSKDVVIELDPGMAFGTGTHETTRMCLSLLEDIVKEGSHVLDIGTGSGILSIGAAKLGAKKITAVDIDNVSVKVAKENAEINGVADKIDILCGNLTDCISGKYDIIVANIIADAIIELSSAVRPFLNENGIYITSGIIDNRLEDVKASLFKNGFEIIEILTEGDWAAVVCR